MAIRLTSAQYGSLRATPGASKRLAAACTPLEGGDIELAVGQNVLTVLKSVNPDDLASAATRVGWSTTRGGVLFATVAGADLVPEAAQEPQEAPAEPGGRQTKGGTVLRLLKRPEGATNAEIRDATGWQEHTVRGFFAGAQMKRTGYKAERFEREGGVHAYRAVKREA